MRKSMRARRLLLHVNVDGTVELVIPRRVSKKQALKFLHDHRGWVLHAIKRHAALHKLLPQRKLTSGTLLPCFGNMIVLSVCINNQQKITRTMQQSNNVTIYVNNPSRVRDAVVRWYTKKAKEFFTNTSHTYAATLGESISSIRVRDMKTQWGSCNHKKKQLVFNWRLALGPVSVAHYVAAHEAAHLKIRGHTKQFWSIVGQIQEEHTKNRTWLRKYGYTLAF